MCLFTSHKCYDELTTCRKLVLTLRWRSLNANSYAKEHLWDIKRKKSSSSWYLEDRYRLKLSLKLTQCFFPILTSDRGMQKLTY